MRAYRSKFNLEVKHLKWTLSQLISNNADTRKKFEAEVDDIHVIVTPKDGDVFARFAGTVVGFLSEERLSVMDESSRVVVVKLDRITPDETKWHDR